MRCSEQAPAVAELGVVRPLPRTFFFQNKLNHKHTLKQMARVSTFLYFPRSTEAAFLFYKSVFGTEFSRSFMRFNDIPPQPGQPPLDAADKNLIMHVELPILGGHLLMGIDAPESMDHTVTRGNNVVISLEPDTRAETDRLFTALSADGKIEKALSEMFWGAYFGTCVDRFGIHWMFNCVSKS